MIVQSAWDLRLASSHSVPEVNQDAIPRDYQRRESNAGTFGTDIPSVDGFGRCHLVPCNLPLQQSMLLSSCTSFGDVMICALLESRRRCPVALSHTA